MVQAGEIKRDIRKGLKYVAGIPFGAGEFELIACGGSLLIAGLVGVALRDIIWGGRVKETTYSLANAPRVDQSEPQDPISRAQRESDMQFASYTRVDLSGVKGWLVSAFKEGAQKHDIDPNYNNYCTWFGILTQELGELGFSVNSIKDLGDRVGYLERTQTLQNKIMFRMKRELGEHKDMIDSLYDAAEKVGKPKRRGGFRNSSVHDAERKARES